MNSLRKYFLGGKSDDQATSDSPKMNFLKLPGQTQATAKPRAQVVLAPQHGLMDWIRKMNGTPNISGTNGKILNVTVEELAKHNKKTDCWTAISGSVYNITPYLDFHPGGVDEIMKGAGIDATTLFQEIHSWVNYASMLEKCLVGRLISKTVPKEATTVQSRAMPIRLRFDFRQPDTKSLRLFIYTTCATLTKDHLFMQLQDSKKLTVQVFIDGYVHTISIDLLHPVTDDFDIRISPKNRTEIEIDLNKKTEEMWKSIGNFRPNHLSIHSMQDSDPVYFTATLLKRSTVTHDTDWYTFSLPSSVYMSPPIGYHIRLKRLKEGMSIVKPYTVVKRLTDDEDSSSSEKTIELLIKHYGDRTLTPMLQQLNIGETIDMSSCEGTFDAIRIDMCQMLILIAAGTGITPMLRILKHVFQQKEGKDEKKVILLFFNKTEDDILCREDLQRLSNKSGLTIHHILSRADTTWPGETGHIRTDLVKRLLPPLPKSNNSARTLVCVCGPTSFSKLAVTLLNEQGYDQGHLHVFLA